MWPLLSQYSSTAPVEAFYLAWQVDTSLDMPRRGQKNGTSSAIKTASHIRLKYLRDVRSARRAVAPRKLKKESAGND